MRCQRFLLWFFKLLRMMSTICSCIWFLAGMNVQCAQCAQVNKNFVKKKEQSEVSLNLENLRGRIIVETEKVLVVCESCFGEVCKCL